MSAGRSSSSGLLTPHDHSAGTGSRRYWPLSSASSSSLHPSRSAAWNGADPNLVEAVSIDRREESADRPDAEATARDVERHAGAFRRDRFEHMVVIDAKPQE